MNWILSISGFVMLALGLSWNTLLNLPVTPEQNRKNYDWMMKQAPSSGEANPKGGSFHLGGNQLHIQTVIDTAKDIHGRL